MSNILISTIVRNRESTLPLWLTQIRNLVSEDPSNNYYLSIYENDSEDGSLELIKSFDYSFAKNYSVITEKLGTPQWHAHKEGQKTWKGEGKEVIDGYGDSHPFWRNKFYYLDGVFIMSTKDRVDMLANARNKSIYECGFLEDCDYVLSIEPDIRYTPSEALQHIILPFAHNKNNKNYDILSGRSMSELRPGDRFNASGNSSNTAPSDWHFLLYDSWATRRTKPQQEWDFDVDLEGIMPVWSTYNCFCMYNAAPFKRRITFSGFNARLNKWDCDTSVVCEGFRSHGYNNIYMDCNFRVGHI